MKDLKKKKQIFDNYHWYLICQDSVYCVDWSRDYIIGYNGDESYAVTFEYRAIEGSTTEQLTSNETIDCNRISWSAHDVYKNTDEITPIIIDVLDKIADIEGDIYRYGLIIIVVEQPEDYRGTTEIGYKEVIYTLKWDNCNKPSVMKSSSHTAQFRYTIKNFDNESIHSATVYVTVECIIFPIANDHGSIYVSERDLLL